MWCAKIQCKIQRKPNEMASNQNKTKDYQKPNQRLLIHTVYSYSPQSLISFVEFGTILLGFFRFWACSHDRMFLYLFTTFRANNFCTDFSENHDFTFRHLESCWVYWYLLLKILKFHKFFMFSSDQMGECRFLINITWMAIFTTCEYAWRTNGWVIG